jgi:purine-cytosine permease-like protein
MSGLMSESKPLVLKRAGVARAGSRPKRWSNMAGAWLGIGTSPGILLVGAGIAARYNGPIPAISILLSFLLMFAILWYQGQLGMAPPHGEGGDLNKITPRYFGPLMQRVIGAVIAIGMIGWFGFNVGLGGAALSTLLNLPAYAGPLIIALPILALSLFGIRSWNSLAAVSTIVVLVLVGLVVWRLSARIVPVTFSLASPINIIMDVAAFVGYISVFSVRAPDFTSNLNSRKDLGILEVLLCLPILLIALAGVGLQQGTGSLDLVQVLSRSDGLPIGNLLLAVAVIAPTFTTLYSGAPSLRASIGIGDRLGMILITVIGLILAISRFDLRLIGWVAVLAAMLPPLLVPLAVESTMRRRKSTPRLIPIWVWLPGSMTSVVLTIARQPLAALIGLSLSGIATGGWYLFSKKKPH